MPRYKASEVKDAREILDHHCPPGTTIYAICTHVARSGMSRRLKLFVVRNDEVYTMTWAAAVVLGWPLKDGEIVVGGCGMDMGFHTVHSLSYALHGMKDVGDAAVVAGTQGRPFKPTKNAYRAGYSLRHEWL